MSCNLAIGVLQRGINQPASLANIDVFRVDRFLFWEIETYIRTIGTNMQGQARLTLPYAKYRFRANWAGRSANYWATLNFSDAALTIWV